jgi:hypothetical protein
MYDRAFSLKEGVAMCVVCQTTDRSPDTMPGTGQDVMLARLLRVVSFLFSWPVGSSTDQSSIKEEN